MRKKSLHPQTQEPEIKENPSTRKSQILSHTSPSRLEQKTRVLVEKMRKHLNDPLAIVTSTHQILAKDRAAIVVQGYVPKIRDHQHPFKTLHGTPPKQRMAEHTPSPKKSLVARSPASPCPIPSLQEIRRQEALARTPPPKPPQLVD